MPANVKISSRDSSRSETWLRRGIGDVPAGTPADLKTAFAPTLASCEDGAPEADRPFDAADAQLLDDIAGPLRALKII